MNEVTNAAMNTNAIKPTATGGVNTSTSERFVINLCASMTPMPAVPKNLKGFEEYKLYQVSRVEDGRRRFRLRLGFFNCEADAELLLSSVRGLYPAAFTGCATPEDLRFNNDASVNPRTASPPAAMPSAVGVNSTASATKAAAATSPAPTTAVAVEKPVAMSPPQPIQAAKTSVSAGSAATQTTHATTSSDKSTQIAATHSPNVAATATPAADSSTDEMRLEFMPTVEPGVPPQVTHVSDVRTLENKPFHVARGITLPEISLDFAPEPAAAPTAAKPAAVVQKSAAHQAARSTTSPSAITAAANALSKSPLKPAVIDDDYVPILDTTLTIRTLTQTEVDDPNKPKWFVVQLACSEHPFNLEAMPRLDIFSAYRLYSVVVTEGGAIRHTLRLGFFRENVSAEAVSGYLKVFFPTPTVTRVSVAEYERFAESAPAAAPQQNKVVKLSYKREQEVADDTAKATPAHAATVPPKPVASMNSAPNSNTNSNKINNASNGNKAAVAKNAAKVALATNRLHQAQVARPQSFLSRLIGRDLD